MSRLGSHWITDDFQVREFRCRGQENGEPCDCFGSFKVHDDLLAILQHYRSTIAIPVSITSAQRCRSWNEYVGGHPKSFHRVGMAADITCDLIRSPTTIMDQASLVAEIAEGVLPGRCNILVYKANKFIHVDVGHRVAEDLIREKDAR